MVPVPLPAAVLPELAPFAPAREVDFSVLRLTAFTVRLRLFKLRRTYASALSFRMEMLNDPPTPTRPPAAEAFAAISRTSALCASTRTSPFAVSFAPLPRRASVYAPEIISATTGLMEMPPELPAFASIISFPLWATVISILVSGASFF